MHVTNYFISNHAKRSGLTVIVLAFVAFPVFLTPVKAGEGETAFERLVDQYHRQREKYENAYFSAKTDEERTRANREFNPAILLLDPFFELEKLHRGSNAGLSALYHIIADTLSRNDPAFKAKRRALIILKDHYATEPDLDYVVRILSPTSTLPEQQAFFKVVEAHPTPSVRAMVLLQRAENRRDAAKYPVEIDSKIELLSTNAQRFEEELDRLNAVRRRWGDMDPTASRREALSLVNQIADDYADVLLPPRVGRSPVLLPSERKKVDPLTNRRRHSYGEAANSIKFQLTRLTIGSKAPEISGPDALGEKRSLRAQRGKVVVLMFSFKGCGPCEAMYPDNRALVKKHADRPFAFLGVMGDETIESVTESLDQGVITWPVWWDGNLDGPIASRWNVEGWPETYVIDHLGVIRYRGVRDRALAIAVEKLLGEAEQSQ